VGGKPGGGEEEEEDGGGYSFVRSGMIRVDNPLAENYFKDLCVLVPTITVSLSDPLHAWSTSTSG